MYILFGYDILPCCPHYLCRLSLQFPQIEASCGKCVNTRAKREDEFKRKEQRVGERGSSQHPCQCGLLGRTEPLRCDWSAAPILVCDWLARLTMWRLLDSVLSELLSMPHWAPRTLPAASAPHSATTSRTHSAVSRDRLYTDFTTVSERTNQKDG